MKKPEDFRNLLIKPGSPVGLFGDGDDQDNWTNNRVIPGVLKKYLLLRRSAWNHAEDIWDTGALIELETPIIARGYSRTSFEGTHVLVMLHDPHEHYDANDATVHVLGVKDQRLLVANPIERRVWEPGTERLAYRAVLIDLLKPGDLAQALMAKYG